MLGIIRKMILINYIMHLKHALKNAYICNYNIFINNTVLTDIVSDSIVKINILKTTCSPIEKFSYVNE